MSELINRNILTTVSLKGKPITLKCVPVSSLKVEKIDSVNFSAWKLMDFSSLRPAVRIGKMVIYKTKENPVAS